MARKRLKKKNHIRQRLQKEFGMLMVRYQKAGLVVLQKQRLLKMTAESLE